MHSYSEEYGKYLAYAFIVHGKNTLYHKHFTNESLDKTYKAYFVEDADMPDWYIEDYEEYYNGAIEKQKETVKKVDIDNSIKNYIGYWIYLRKYNDQFYINHDWAWVYTFHISNKITTKHYMDGPSPFVIEFFKKNKNGDFLIKTTDDDSIIQYELIDKELEIYKQGEDYVVPARNALHFEIIEYANNTGNLMVSF